MQDELHHLDLPDLHLQDGFLVGPQLLAQASQAQQAPGPGLQFRGEDRLAEEIVGARPDRFAVAFRVLVHGDDQDRDVVPGRVGPEVAADLESVGVRKQEVQHHQVRKSLGKALDRLPHGFGRPRPVAAILQDHPEEIQGHRHVFDHEDHRVFVGPDIVTLIWS